MRFCLFLVTYKTCCNGGGGGGGRDESVLRHMRSDFEGINFFVNTSW